MNSVKTIVNAVSYVLIAFVSISLVVSSIMIGIITYISVYERTKEIGILRSIGASKGNISAIFNAETFIIGLLSGLFGIGISYILIPIINGVLHHFTGNIPLSAALNIGNALVLVLLSIILTLIGGLIPARSASKKDPVEALRSE
jgi:putative ABC transport system permease protein